MTNARNSDPSPDIRPSEAELVFLDHRAAEISVWLAGTSPGSVETLILPLLVAMAARSAGDADAGYIRRIYAEVLSPQPHFAIARACQDFLTGRAGDGHWRPEPGEIYQRAEYYAKRYRDELAEIYTVLEFARRNKNQPEPDRGCIAKLIRATADGMRASNSVRKREVHPPLATVDIEEKLMAEYCNKPLPRLSEEMKKLLGCGVPEISE